MTLDRVTAATVRARGIAASEVGAVTAIATGARKVILVTCSRETSTCRVGLSASPFGHVIHHSNILRDRYAL
jgi:hypothetical protein